MTDPSEPIHCPHHPACPGCPLLELPYADQLEHKRKTVKDALQPYGLFDDTMVVEPRPAPTTIAYRVRAKLVVDTRGIGLFAHGTHDVVDTPQCRVLRPAVAHAVQELRRLPLHRAGVTSVDVREVDDGVLVTLASEYRDSPSLASLLTEVPKRMPDVVSLSVSTRERAAAQVLGRAPVVIAGVASARHTPDPEAPYHYAGPGAFTQAHPGQLVRLHRHIQAALVQHLGNLDGCRVLELYAGTGALGLRLARAGARVTLVENFAPSMELAARAATEQGLSVEVQTADAGEAIVRLAAQGARFDAILVNPPRRGVAPQVRQGMPRLAPRVAVYVSCEPRTLARDLADLARLGLSATELHPYDMIPLSDAVETLAILSPSEPVAPRVLYADDALIAVNKPAHEPVLPQDGDGGSLLERVRRTLDAPEAVALHPMQAGASGVCVFARDRQTASVLTGAVQERITTWIVLAKGIMHPKGSLRGGTRKGVREESHATRYVREQVVGGHSWLSVRTNGNDGLAIHRVLVRIGHPVVGDEKHGDARTNQHFLHRHGLDRQFLHIASVRLPRGDTMVEVQADLAPDLVAVRESLEG